MAGGEKVASGNCTPGPRRRDQSPEVLEWRGQLGLTSDRMKRDAKELCAGARPVWAVIDALARLNGLVDLLRRTECAVASPVQADPTTLERPCADPQLFRAGLRATDRARSAWRERAASGRPSFERRPVGCPASPPNGRPNLDAILAAHTRVGRGSRARAAANSHVGARSRTGFAVYIDMRGARRSSGRAGTSSRLTNSPHSRVFTDVVGAQRSRLARVMPAGAISRAGFRSDTRVDRRSNSLPCVDPSVNDENPTQPRDFSRPAPTPAPAPRTARPYPAGS
jgi:hypothetical protein